MRVSELPSRLRIGLMLAGRRPPRWQAELAHRLATIDGLQLVVIPAPIAESPHAWPFLTRRVPALEPTPLDPAIAVSPEIPVDLDLLLSMTGFAESGTKDHGNRWLLCDEALQPLGQPFPCLAGVTAGRGATVAVLRQGPAGKQVLDRARFTAPTLYWRALERMYAEAIRLTVRTVQDTLEGLAPWMTGTDDTMVAPGGQGAAGPWRAVISGLWRAARSRLRGIAEDESWMVGVIDEPIARLPKLPGPPTIRWLGGRDSSRGWADPFGVPGSADRLLCEEIPADSGIGRIKELSIAGDTVQTEAAVALPLPGHLSYPFLFEHEGRLYCVPEALATRACELLRLETDGRWRRAATLIRQVDAADPTLFSWEGRFWLAFSDAENGVHDTLHLWFADTLTGEWRPHARNPVKVDHHSSRPAGTPFVSEGVLFRPAQDCSATYGGAVAINRVTLCSPEGFREETVAVLRPSPGDFNRDGLHTVSSWGERTLVDGKRHGFNPRVVRRKLRRRLAALRESTARLVR